MEKHKAKPRNGKFDEGLILDHKIPHIHPPNTKVVDTVVYSTRRPALEVKNGIKKFGNTLVLHGLNMHAKAGTIYCLVGASNSGKSTILSCITGQKRLTKGEVLVFGTKPGSRASGIPGHRVGWMPQELALNCELSITQVLEYMGRLNGLTLNQIAERTEKLASVLDLQHLSTCLNDLSPGLQKRTSLACALIHEPELIVLDLPTFGMDILFQKGIWMHLQTLVSNGRTSVILSCQNIEEACQANRVGVLRSGRLLVEDNPKTLLQRHGTQLLSEAVSKLSIKDTIRLKKDAEKKGGAEVICMDEWTSLGVPSGSSIEDNPNVIPSVSYKEWMEQVEQGDEDQIAQNLKSKSQNKGLKKKEKLPPYPNPSRLGHRLRALFIKEFIIFKKNIWLALISLLIPFALICGVCHSIGTPLKGLRVGVVNLDFMEAEGFTNNDEFGANGTTGDGFSSRNCLFLEGCTDRLLSCRVLDKISGDSFVNYQDFNNVEDALEEMQEGNIFALIQIEKGFSSEVYSRLTESLKENDESVSNLKFVFDESRNILATQLLRQQFSTAVEKFEEQLSKDCNKNSKGDISELVEFQSNSSSKEFETVTTSNLEALDIDEDNGDEEFGESSGEITTYLPGIVVLIAFFTPLFTSGIYFLHERQTGVLKRVKVSGGNAIEVLLIDLFYQIPLVLGQTAILILVPMFLFNVEINGWWVWQTLLVGITGFSGLSFSLLLSTIFIREKQIYMIGLYSLVTALVLSGILWPTESQHWVLQWVSYVLPWTLTTSTLRAIMVNGLDILHPYVWHGFVTISAWTLAYWLILFIILLVKFLKR